MFALALCAVARAGGIGLPFDYAVGVGQGCTHATLAAALATAAAAPGPSRIGLAASGTYTDLAVLISDPNPVTITGGYPNCLGFSPVGTTPLDGNDSDSVIRISGAGAVTLENLTISDGRGTLVDSNRHGGGVHHTGSGLLTVRDSVIRDNIAALGGGLSVKGAASLLMERSEVLDNFIDLGGPSAGIFVDSTGTVTVSDVRLAGNQSSGLRVIQAASVVLQDVRVHDNDRVAANEHAVRLSGHGEYAVRDSTIVDNRGGGLQYDGFGSLEIESSTISDNGFDPATIGTGPYFGGGLVLSGGAPIEIRDSTIAGNASGSGGGGIRYTGYGLLLLEHCEIADNVAGPPSSGSGSANVDGGGIHLDGDQQLAPPRLELRGGTRIVANDSTGNGGGLWMRSAELDADDAGLLSFADNRAGSHGGGLYLRGGSARIGSGAPGALFVGNEAVGTGGAIHATASAHLQVFATGAGTAPAFVANRANANNAVNNFFGGGALQIENEAPVSKQAVTPTRVLLFDVLLQDNSASFGGALSMLSLDAPSELCVARAIDPNACVAFAAFLPEGAVSCVDATSCNRLNNNHASYQGDAIARAGKGAAMIVAGARIDGHSGSSLVFSSYANFDQDGATLELRDSLLADNVSFGPLFAGFTQPTVPNLEFWLGHVLIERSTVAGNVVGAAYVFQSRSGLTLRESIVHQPGTTVHAGNPGGVLAQDVIAHETSTLPVRLDVISADPLFVDPVNGDFHLGNGSPGLDFADFGNDGVDLDGVPRGFDLPTVIDRFGPRDLGAYERGPATLFRDGFEGSDPV